MMLRHNEPKSGIVEDGFWRLVQTIEPKIREEVEREFAERMAAASRWKRWLVRRQIEREIERRISQSTPSAKALF